MKHLRCQDVTVSVMAKERIGDIWTIQMCFGGDDDDDQVFEFCSSGDSDKKFVGNTLMVVRPTKRFELTLGGQFRLPTEQVQIHFES